MPSLVWWVGDVGTFRGGAGEARSAGCLGVNDSSKHAESVMDDVPEEDVWLI